MRKLLEQDATGAAVGSQKKSKKKKTGGQVTVSVCTTAPGVCGGMQIWVKTDQQCLIFAVKQLLSRWKTHARALPHVVCTVCVCNMII